MGRRVSPWFEEFFAVKVARAVSLGQALRGSCEEEWAMRFSKFAVSKWIGQSITVSGKRCANHESEGLMKEAAAVPVPLGTAGLEPVPRTNSEGESVVQSAVQHTAESTESEGEQKRKSPEFPGFRVPYPRYKSGRQDTN